MLRLASVFMAVALVSSCVTINIYFPEAAAERAADQIIRDILSKQSQEGEVPQNQKPDSPPKEDSGTSWQRFEDKSLPWALRWVPRAQAQADLSIDTQAIRRLQASMKQRLGALRPYLNSGAVGFAANGDLAIRDLSNVPLKERSKVKNLVAAENRERAALYREIAQANGHPEWTDDVRQTFARRWIANAESGWWYQDSGGNWKRK